MTRFALLSALALAALPHPRADAQPDAFFPGSIRIIDAKADKGKLTWTEYATTPVVREIEVIVNMNGKQVATKQKVTVHEVVPVTKTADLKGAKATDAAGKAIDADKLAERLKESTPVVLVSGAVPAKHRALFKDTTVFVEFPQPKGPPVPAPPGVVVPAPVPLPAPVPPIVLPPGEKKSG